MRLWDLWSCFLVWSKHVFSVKMWSFRNLNMVGFVPKTKMQEMKKRKDASQRHVKFWHNCGLQKTFPPFFLGGQLVRVIHAWQAQIQIKFWRNVLTIPIQRYPHVACCIHVYTYNNALKHAQVVTAVTNRLCFNKGDVNKVSSSWGGGVSGRFISASKVLLSRIPCIYVLYVYILERHFASHCETVLIISLVFTLHAIAPFR